MNGNLAVGFSAGFYTDSATITATAASSEVPGLYPVALAGHPFLVDLKSEAFKHASIPTLRPYAMTQDTLGEKNINPESLWRSSQNSWHKGAGQRHLDRADSDPARFWASKGIDVWTRWQMKLLPDTTGVRASTNSNLRIVTAGTALFVSDGNTLLRSLDAAAFSAIAGTPAAAITALASDGNTVYAAYTGNGVWTSNRAGTVTTQLVTGTDTLDTLAYVKGRLMASKGRSLYNITSAVAAPLPASLFDHPNPDFKWVGFAEGLGEIYAAGFSGDKTLIYRITLQPDGTALSTPIQAGQLPDGEVVRSIAAYLGIVLIGTDSGVRVCSPSSNGDLSVGPLIKTGAACYCFEGQDRFIWFGWTNYDGTSTGLGRMDLTQFTDAEVPAYASDLMAAGQGTVADVATFGGKRLFAVTGLGFYSESANLVADGTLDSGLITYDLPDPKVALYLDVRHADPLVGTHTSYIAVDEGGFTRVGQHAAGSPEGMFTLPELRGESFEIREELTRDTTPTQGPTVYRHTLLANPAVRTGQFIIVPLLLSESDEVQGQTRTRKPADELAFVKSLREDGTRVTYQEGSATYSVTVSDYEWNPHHLTSDGKAFNGTCVTKLKTV